MANRDPRLSFDHLVGARGGHLMAECLRGLQIDHQLELDERPRDRRRRIIGSPSTLPARPKMAGKKCNFAKLGRDFPKRSMIPLWGDAVVQRSWSADVTGRGR